MNFCAFAARIAFVAAFSLGALAIAAPRASAAEPISLLIDCSKIPTQNIAITRETIPVKPGAMTLYYPEWIPGEHAAVGPIFNVAALVIKANGQTIPWRREATNMFAFDLTVPAGATSMEVDFTYLGATTGRYSSARLGSSNMYVITWNQNLFYPSTGTIQDTIIKPTMILPGSNWQFATAVTGAKRAGNTVTWDDTSLEHLIDSPLDAGINFHRWDIWSDGAAHAYLNVIGDQPQDVDVSSDVVGHYGKLVREMIAMYGARHWRNYNFLLTVSDVIPGEGIEHHESSDDGGRADYLTNPVALERGADLLSHEFNHSWDGKYRMPAGLYPSNLNTAYDDYLLWVYEGMTQYYGDVMSFRDGLREQKYFPDHIAAIYAHYDNQPGRLWRSLGDTATSGPFLYYAPFGYGLERRGVDFYAEGELLWLKVDSIIRDKTNDKMSLDDFSRAFFGGQNTGPDVVTYTRADVVAGLNKLVPYDWDGFFTKWVDDIAVHPPDGFSDEGYKLVYTDQPSHDVPRNNFVYSLGLAVGQDGTIGDVAFGSPAFKADLGINQKIVAVNGREFSPDLLYQAVKNAKGTTQPITLLVERTLDYRTVTIDYHGGPRYPHLVRQDGMPDRLMEVPKPRT